MASQLQHAQQKLLRVSPETTHTALEAHIASPMMTISALSVKPKPMNGSIVVRNRILSCSLLAGRSGSGLPESTFVAHTLNSA
eukprot:4821024-Pleurochrysis_carterae.AAC.2